MSIVRHKTWSGSAACAQRADLVHAELSRGTKEDHGGVAEWSIAPVLKTGVSQGTVSSNLTSSADLNVVLYSRNHVAICGFVHFNTCDLDRA